jgi:hypothetical protein
METLCGVEGVFVVILSGDFSLRRGKSCFGMDDPVTVRMKFAAGFRRTS